MPWSLSSSSSIAHAPRTIFSTLTPSSLIILKEFGQKRSDYCSPTWIRPAISWLNDSSFHVLRIDEMFMARRMVPEGFSFLFYLTSVFQFSWLFIVVPFPCHKGSFGNQRSVDELYYGKEYLCSIASKILFMLCGYKRWLKMGLEK